MRLSVSPQVRASAQGSDLHPGHHLSARPFAVSSPASVSSASSRAISAQSVQRLDAGVLQRLAQQAQGRHGSTQSAIAAAGRRSQAAAQLLRRSGQGPVPQVQAAFEPAYVIDTAHLHQLDAKGQVQSGRKGWVGNKLQPGELVQADADASKHQGEWVPAQHNQHQGVIRKGSILFLQDIPTPPQPLPTPQLDQPTSLSETAEIVGQSGGISDVTAGGIESGFLKQIDQGHLKDKADASQSLGTGKSSLDVVAGTGDTAAGVLSLVESARSISQQNTRWKNLEAGYGFVESVGKATSGSTKVVDAFAKALGNKEGAGQSDVVGKYTASVADALGSLKRAALGVIGLYKVYRSQSSEKPKEAAVSFGQLTEAALGAAKVAKSAYDIIGNGIPLSVLYTIPSLSLALSMINTLVRLADALQTGQQKTSMGDRAERSRAAVSILFNQPYPPDPAADSPLFDKTRRGTFPAYKTYFRVKQGIQTMLESAAEVGDRHLEPLQQSGSVALVQTVNRQIDAILDGAAIAPTLQKA